MFRCKGMEVQRMRCTTSRRTQHVIDLPLIPQGTPEDFKGPIKVPLTGMPCSDS